MHLAVGIPALLLVCAFCPEPPPHSSFYKSARRTRWRWKIGGTTTNNNKSGVNEERGGGERPTAAHYQFGDLTRGLLKKGQAKVNEITGKEAGAEYQFGDLARHLDAKAKERILKSRSGTSTSSTTGVASTNTGASDGEKDQQQQQKTQQHYSYQLGDLSRWASHLVQEKAANFSGKDTAEDYQLGDVTKTIVSRVRSGEYRMDDVYLALRILAVAGVAILPITNALPIQLLLQLAEADLAKDVSLKIAASVATSLDARFKLAITGKSDYQLGDMTKDQLKRQVAQFTGMTDYEFGDVFRALVSNKSNSSSDKSKNVQGLSKVLFSQDSAEQEILRWDERFLLAGNSSNNNSTTLNRT